MSSNFIFYIDLANLSSFFDLLALFQKLMGL